GGWGRGVGEQEGGEGGRAAGRHGGQDSSAATECVAHDGLRECVESGLHEHGVSFPQTLHDHVRRRQQIELDREREDDRLPQEKARHQHEGRRSVFAHAGHDYCRRSSRRLWRTVVTNSKNRGCARVLSTRGRGRSTGTTRSMLPGRGLITTIRLDRNTASAMLWVTNRTVAA